MTMKIRLRYFASLREVTGQSEETITLADGADVAAVRTHLAQHYPRLQPLLERCAYAVNRSYVPTDTVLKENDELVFIPPMGGGDFE